MIASQESLPEGHQDVPELIPVRMLNEFCYCPRLAYLEWIQTEFEDNLETREGTFAHRRVDKPGRREVPAAEPEDELSEMPEEGTGDVVELPGNLETHGKPKPEPLTEKPEPEKIHARSLLLSAPEEGLIAKLDLLELEGNSVTPVDYKRGRLPDIREGAWEPERVQLCAQGLILKEAGYECEWGVLYFVESHRRVTIEFDQPLIDRTRELIQQLREMGRRGILPAPLVDSPKCPRCSLVGICLPDETNFVKLEVKQPPRRLQPAKDTALPLYLQAQGLTLGKAQQRLTVSERGKVIQETCLKDVSQVCLYGNIQVTAQALRELSLRNVPVCHFTYGGWFHAITQGLMHKNVELRLAQYRAATTPEIALKLAKQFVIGKIKNSRTLLRRHAEEDQKGALRQLVDLAERAGQVESAESLLGIEGTAARTYFAGFGTLIRGAAAFDFQTRNRRPPTDPINALLSFVYSLLVKDVAIVLQAVGFDPMLGLYHRPRYGRPSLALDLAEEFRPLIGDSVVLTLINNREVTEDHVISRAGAVALTDVGRRAVLNAYERRLQTEVTHPVFGYRISYRRILEVQARLLSRVLLGELETYPNFCTR